MDSFVSLLVFARRPTRDVTRRGMARSATARGGGGSGVGGGGSGGSGSGPGPPLDVATLHPGQPLQVGAGCGGVGGWGSRGHCRHSRGSWALGYRFLVPSRGE